MKIPILLVYAIGVLAVFLTAIGLWNSTGIAPIIITIGGFALVIVFVTSKFKNITSGILAVLIVSGVIWFPAGVVGNPLPDNYQRLSTQPAQAEAVNPALITDNSGTLSMSVQNEKNTTATQYLASTVRVYKSEDLNTLFGTVTTISTGTGRGTLTIDKYTASGLPQQYTYFVPAVDGSMTSVTGTFTGAENVQVNALVSEQSTLRFKVYDEEARGYLFESTENASAVTAGTLYVTGKTFGSTTANTSTAVGTGGFYDYTVYVSTNGTASTTTRFDDQILILAIDAQDLSDWNKPSISIPGATVVELSPGTYNDKIKNDGYDWVYQITGTHLDSTFTKMRIQQYAKTAVNPTDDIKLALYTGGYYQHTLDPAMGMDTHKDDASQTAVYTAQDLTLSIS